MTKPQDIKRADGRNSRAASIAKLRNYPSSSWRSSSPRMGSSVNSFNGNQTFLRHGSFVGENEELNVFSRSMNTENTSKLYSYSDNESSDSKEEANFAAGMHDPKVVHQLNKHLKKQDKNPMALEGGDITREIYKVTEQDAGNGGRRRSISSSEVERATSNGSRASSINVPGGFRREYILQSVREPFQTKNVNFVTKNFVEFLSIFGHFAGEDLENEDDLIACHYKPAYPVDEEAPLLARDVQEINTQRTATNKKAYFLLLKAFVGTGILFLPKAFSNGGLLFSSLILLFFGLLSYWCYLVLIYAMRATRATSFGEIGRKLYGRWFQEIILVSIVVSQIGFIGAYIIFTGENLRAFTVNISSYTYDDLPIGLFILGQLILFLPLSLVRDITKLSLLALLANVFILVGILTIIYFIMVELIQSGTVAGKGINFLINTEEFSLFIGVAIFAFEGIGLIIPIHESMIHPEAFPKVLFQVIVTISIAFVLIATLGYLAFGQDVNTNIISNLPQNSPLVVLIELLYAISISLSTPLQLFPAIRLVEQKLFTKTGKKSLRVKWTKNFFRFAFVFLTMMIAYYGGQNLDRFVSFVGCFACIPLVYIYPPLLHSRSCCFESDTLSEKENRKRFFLRRLNYFLIIVGTAAMFYTTYQIVNS